MKQLSSTMRSFVVLAFIFLGLTLSLPANKVAMRKYNLTPSHYHLILFLVELPLTLIWFAAFYGYGQLNRYATSVEKSKEGQSFRLLAHGCRWLAWGLAVPAIISLILNSIANAHPGFFASAVIIESYIALLVPVGAFMLLSNGSRLLSKHARLRISTSALKVIFGAFVILGVLYCYLTFRQLDLHNTTSTANPFYLPTWLMVLTITIPYLFAWFIGLLAAYEIGLVGKKAQGILYRQSLRVFAIGITLVIASSITLQYVTSIEPRTLHLSLNSTLVTNYIIRFVAGVGYLAIARGANRLRKFEEV
jgi:hypothetical protein